MKIVIAPNALKGSLTAEEAVEVIATGVKAVIESVDIVKISVADGGDGMRRVLQRSIPEMKECSVEVADPLGRMRQASFLLDEEKRVAIIEMAEAAGYALTVIPVDDSA